MADKPFVVSADGHILEPTDLFMTRLPKHLRDRAVWEEDFEIEPLVEGGARIFRRLHTPGFEGWTDLPLPPDRRADARGRPRAASSRTSPSTASTSRSCTPTSRSSASTPTTTSSRWRTPASTTTTSSSGSRRTSTRLAPTAPVPLTDVADAVAEIERVAAGGFRAILLPAVPPKPYYSRDFDPVWAAAQANGVHVFIHTQTGGVKVNDPESTTLEGGHGERGAGQPADDREVRLEAHGHPGDLQHDRAPAGDLPAGRRRRARALPRPALRADRVQRALAVLAGRGMDKCWVTGIGQDADWWLGHWDEVVPPTNRPNMAQLFRLNEKWPYPLTPSEYVRAPVPRVVPGRPGGGRLPAHHRSVDDRLGQRLPARRRHVPRQPRADQPSSSSAYPTTSATPCSAARSAGCSASSTRGRLSGPHLSELRFDGRVAVVTGAGRGIGRAYALLLAGAGAAVVVNDLGGSMDGHRRDTDRPRSRRDRDRRRRRHARRRHAAMSLPRGRAGPDRAAAIENFGRIDVVINNAGIIRWAGFPDVDEDNLAAHLAVHIGGSFNTTRAAWPHMVDAGLRPHRDDHVERRVRTQNNTSYATAKAAVIGLTRSLAVAGAEARHPGQLHRAGRHDPDGRWTRSRPAADGPRARRADGGVPRARVLPGERRDLRRRRRTLRPHLPRHDARATCIQARTSRSRTLRALGGHQRRNRLLGAARPHRTGQPPSCRTCRPPAGLTSSGATRRGGRAPRRRSGRRAAGTGTSRCGGRPSARPSSRPRQGGSRSASPRLRPAVALGTCAPW